MNPNNITEERINSLVGELNKSPWFFLGFRTKRLRIQTEFFQAQTAKHCAFEKSVLELQKLKETFEKQKALEDKSFEAQMELAKTTVEAEIARRKLLELATELGMTIEHYSEVQKATALVDIELHKQREMIAIDVDKHRQLKEIDHENLVKEINARVEGALKLQLLSSEQSLQVLTKLAYLKDQLYALETSGQPIQLIMAKRKDYLMVIQGMEALLGRLLQIDSRQDAGGSDKDTILAGLVEPDSSDGKE